MYQKDYHSTNVQKILKTVISLTVVGCLGIMSGCTTGSLDTQHSTVIKASDNLPFTHKGITYSQCPSGKQFRAHYKRQQENWSTDGLTYWSLQAVTYQHRANLLAGDYLRLDNVQRVGNRIYCNYVLHRKDRAQRSKQLTLRLETHPFKQLKVAGYNWNKCSSHEICHSICRTSKPSTCPFDYTTVKLATKGSLPVPVHSYSTKPMRSHS